jgi:hypothetical protein
MFAVLMASLEIHDSKWRRACFFTPLFLIGQQAWALLFAGRFRAGQALAALFGVALGALATRAKSRRITVQDEILSGPSRHGRRRVEISIQDIDRQRSAVPGLFGSRTIWSHAGAAIYIDAVSIPKAERERLLELLGLPLR